MSHPIFIVEGPDACGKTTLCRKLQERIGARYIHMTLRREMFLYQLGSLALAIRWSVQSPVLIDRHWPSENIYAAVYRGGTPLREESAWTRWLCEQLGVFYVACVLRDDERCAQAHAETAETGREMYEPDERILRVAAAYRAWAHGGELGGEFAEVAWDSLCGGVSNADRGFGYDYESPVWAGRDKYLCQYLHSRALAVRKNDFDYEALQLIEAQAKSRRTITA